MSRFRRDSWSVGGFSRVQDEMQLQMVDQLVFDSIRERRRAVAVLGNPSWAAFLTLTTASPPVYRRVLPAWSALIAPWIFRRISVTFCCGKPSLRQFNVLGLENSGPGIESRKANPATPASWRHFRNHNLCTDSVGHQSILDS